MNYVINVVYNDDEVDDAVEWLALGGYTDVHILSDSTPFVGAAPLTTASISEQLVLQINKELAMATAARCAASATERWGTTHRMGRTA